MLAYSGAKSQSGPLANGHSSVHPAPCIVLGLSSNSPSSRLRNGNRSPCELQEPTTKVSTKEKQQIPDIVEQDTTVRVASVMPRCSDHTKFPRHFLVLESTGVNGGMLSAKRKRGRRANKKKKLRTVYILDEEQGEVASSDSDNPVGAAQSSARLPDHSVQSMGSAYEALMIEKRAGMSDFNSKPRPIVLLVLLLMHHHHLLVSFLCFFAGVITLLLLPALAKNSYVSENALVPGSGLFEGKFSSHPSLGLEIKRRHH